MVSDAGLDDAFEIDSAGTAGYHVGSPPDHRMAAALADAGYYVIGNARQLAAADLARYDHILTMDEENLRDARLLDPEGGHHRKITHLVSYCTAHDDKRVPDPYYGGPAGFQHVLRLLEDACSNLLLKLSPR